MDAIDFFIYSDVKISSKISEVLHELILCDRSAGIEPPCAD